MFHYKRHGYMMRQLYIEALNHEFFNKRRGKGECE